MFGDADTWLLRLKISVFGANLEMVGSASAAVPQEASGIEDCHGGCAPFLDDDVPSVATSRDADFQKSMSSASTGSSESLPSISDPDTSPCMDAGFALPVPMFEGTYAPGPS